MYLFLKKSYTSDENAHRGVRVSNKKAQFLKKQLVTTNN